MKTYYLVYIEYDSQHWPEWDNILKSKVGYSDSSGMGFGKRDHSYSFDTKKKADNFRKKLVKHLKNLDIHIGKVEKIED